MVRNLHRLEDFERCIELERRVWGGADIDVVPLPIFVVSAEVGGQVLGAYAGREMVGFTLAMPGVRRGKPFLHSHMTAVVPEYQNRGVGRLLKMAQREEAIARGIPLVEWTFDPLELRNAYFNVERLGAIVRRYLPNCYGITTSPLHGGLPTDRLVAEWWLRSPRVEAALAGNRGEGIGEREKAAVRIEVPKEIGELRQTDAAEAARIQSRIREEFVAAFRNGLAVTGFVVDENQGTYLLNEAKDVPQSL